MGLEGLPLNVAFFFEGEEENGSKGAQIALEDNIRWFENTALTVMCNTQWVGEEVPCLTYGMRGMLSMNVEVSRLTGWFAWAVYSDGNCELCW